MYAHILAKSTIQDQIRFTLSLWCMRVCEYTYVGMVLHLHVRVCARVCVSIPM